jgi:2-amino-4-hydroxy-6-hydroxymethyldihydropteridine diphosphokinase
LKRIYLSLGSNVGDRERHLSEALQALARMGCVSLTAISPCYETEPVGDSRQGRFLNIAVAIETDLAPLELLDAMKQLELELGRVPTRRWGPRVIDIDLILWGDTVLDTARLTLPHPHFRERAFVLAPLAQIAPDAVDPVTGKTVRELADAVGDDGVAAFADWNNEPPRLEP